jgi:serine-type D-Ala-D-Ala carboxypeptidase/endopeptidase (penicillin-binding protein 4)
MRRRLAARAPGFGHRLPARESPSRAHAAPPITRRAVQAFALSLIVFVVVAATFVAPALAQTRLQAVPTFAQTRSQAVPAPAQAAATPALPKTSATPVASQTRSQATLDAAIDRILTRNHLATGTVSVSVWDMQAADQVYARNTATLLAPASNEKLVTSAAALGLWGGNYHFKTELYATAPAPGVDGVLHADLYLKGYGDPTLSEGWYQRKVLHLATSDLQHFVGALKALGVTRIVGSVFGDESQFDQARQVAGWKPGFADECAPLSALTLNGNSPPGHTVLDPARYAAQELVHLLRTAGIGVTRGANVGTTPGTATLLHTEYSAPLWRVVKAMDKTSDNFIAEMLTKGLGRDFGGAGTTAAGVKVARDYVSSLGVDVAQTRLRDGSGLSYQDRLSTAVVTELLKAVADKPYFMSYWTALPVAAVDGTLRTRMKGTAAAGKLHGKTGTLNIASSLSGYVTTADGHDLVFSMLMNGHPINVTAAHTAQDAIGAALAAARL